MLLDYEKILKIEEKEKMWEVSAWIPIVHWPGVQHAALQGRDNGISVPAAQRQPVLTTFSIHNGFSLL